MLSSLPRVYPLLGLCGGYAIVMLFNPVREALRDGFRCIARFKRIWLTFVLLGFSICHLYSHPELGGSRSKPGHLAAELVLAETGGGMARDAIARAGRCRGNFR